MRIVFLSFHFIAWHLISFFFYFFGVFILILATIKHLFQSTRPKIIFCDGNVYLNVAVIGKILKSKVYTMKDHRMDLPKIDDLLEPTNAELFYT